MHMISNHWTVRSGSWSVSNGYYNMVGSSDNLCFNLRGKLFMDNYVLKPEHALSVENTQVN
jgi:hypothetical protein